MLSYHDEGGGTFKKEKVEIKSKTQAHLALSETKYWEINIITYVLHIIWTNATEQHGPSVLIFS